MSTVSAGSSLKSPWLIGFGLVAIAQLALVVFRLPPQFAFISTWLVALVLAVWAWRARGPKLLVLALLLCWVGDVLGNPLLIGLGPSALILSVAAFAAATLALIILFLRSRTDGTGRWRAGVAVLYLVAATAALAVAWSNLDVTLRAAGVVYLLLLVATATTAFMLDIGVGAGALLLFASHLLVVLEVGGQVDGTATVFRLVFWVLYMLGLLLIATRIVAITNPQVAPPVVQT
jgi:hypothetical protein